MSYAPVAGMALWVKGDAGVLDLSGNPCINGVSVKTWQDQSGNTRHLTTPDNSHMPVFNSADSSITFGSGSDDLIRMTLGTGLTTVRTAFIILQSSDTTRTLQFFFGDNSAFDWHAGGDATHMLDSGFASANIIGGSGFVNGASVSPASMLKSSTAQLYDWVTTGNVTIDGLSYDRGARRAWFGKIWEVLLYTTALSTGDRQTVETYLNDKYHLYLPYPSRGGPLLRRRRAA